MGVCACVYVHVVSRHLQYNIGLSPSPCCRLVATEEENKRMKTELAELTARNTFQLKRFDEEKEALQKRMEGEKVEELQKLQEEKQKEMEALHER